MATNIAQTLHHVASRLKDKPGVIEARTGKTVSFTELNRLSDGYAHYLREQGVGPGDRVMLMVKPSADFICLTFGLFKLGVTIILIDPGMGYRNLLRCISGVRPTVFIGIPQARLFAAFFANHFSSVRRYFCCGKSLGLFGPDITRECVTYTEPFPVYTPNEEDLAAIIFTTGSTGPPKGVRYEHGIFAAQLARIRDYYGIGEQDIDQPAFPLFALFSTSLGACSVIPDMNPTRPARVDPEKFIASIRKYGVTYSFGSPAIWKVVGRYCLERGIVLDGLKTVLMAGAPVPGELLKTMQAILPQEARIHTPYGATESLPIVSIEAREILEETWPLSRTGNGTCVGRPLPSIDIAIMKIDDGVVPVFDASLRLGPQRIGEIVVRGDVVTRGYENNQVETSLAKMQDPDGRTFWHRMGDTGFLDETGRLWFCGRRAHRVQTPEGTLYSVCCEAIVNEHPMVSRSALVGMGTGQYRVPALIIEPVREYTGTRDALLREVAQLAAANSLTSTISHFYIHPDFPVDIRHNAKIFREKLAQWATDKYKVGQ